MAGSLGWEIEVDELLVYVSLRSQSDATRVYLLRADFSDFPLRAPSFTFVDPETRHRRADAWPPGVAHSGEKICTLGTREFHEDLHKNDAQYRWDSERYPFLQTVRMIHRLMK